MYPAQSPRSDGAVTYDVVKALEYGENGTAKFDWQVLVPKTGAANNPAYWLMSRRDHNTPTGPYHNMDSPTVRKSGKRLLVEEAVDKLLTEGATQLSKGNVRRVVLTNAGQVTRTPSAQKNRMSSDLVPVSFAADKSGNVVLTAILDQAAPVKYQVVIPFASKHDELTYQYLVHRRLNPRAKENIAYGMLAMSTGRKRVASDYKEHELTAIFEALDTLASHIREGTTARTTLEILNRQLRKHDDEWCANQEPNDKTIRGRLRDLARHVVQTVGNPDSWPAMREAMARSLEVLGPKFEGHEMRLRLEAEKRELERRRAKEQATPPSSGKNATTGLETVANGIAPTNSLGAIGDFLGMSL